MPSKKRIHEGDQREGRGYLRLEARALGDAARHDGRYRGGEGQEEEEAHELVAVALREDRRAAEEGRAVRDGVADEEIRDGRHREVDQDLHQCVHLVLAANGAELEEREPGVHGEHHHGAQQDEQRVGAGLERFHRLLRARGCVPASGRRSAPRARLRETTKPDQRKEDQKIRSPPAGARERGRLPRDRFHPHQPAVLRADACELASSCCSSPTGTSRA
jgi:hypothetical protein